MPDTATPFAVESIRREFPIFDRRIHGCPLVYLDNAATTLKPRCVVDAVSRHYLQGASNVHRGVHTLSAEATEAFEAVREKVRRLIHASRTQEIIFTRGATEGINLVAQSFGRHFLKAGDTVLITGMEHHSNIVPWQMLCESTGCTLKTIPVTDTGELDLSSLDSLLTTDVKFLAVVHVSNSLGTINPLKRLIAKAHACDIPVLVDGAQGISHVPVDVQDLDADFYVFSGHKMFGPTGIGVLYGKEKWLEKMPPVQGGGDMIASVTFEKTTYNTLPYKFEAGTPHIAGVIGLGAAIDFMLGIGLETISRHESELLSHAHKVLAGVPGIRFIGTAKNKCAIISFVIDGIHPHDLGTLVDHEGIAIRTGHHCTQPLMKRFGVPATARASFALTNQLLDADRLAEALVKAKEIFQ